MEWPGGKKFAFTVIDDTDYSSVENVKPVYDFLASEGLITTKTVWPLNPKGPHDGDSLENPSYRDWIVQLQKQGFEIGLHGTSDGPSRREDVIRGINLFRDILGNYPKIHVNHVGQYENLYWGAERFDGIGKMLYKAAVHLKAPDRENISRGHLEKDEFFWGDVCKERITYVRNLSFLDVNTVARDRMMPYHHPGRPWVKYWFSASEGSNAERFCELLSEKNQDRLVEEGGGCLAYTHFAFGFYKDGRLHPRFVELVKRLARLPGWFVPVSTMLDHLKSSRGTGGGFDPRAWNRMQMAWILQKWKTGTK